MTTGTGEGLTRRDLLAGVGAALVAGPFVPRAALLVVRAMTASAMATFGWHRGNGPSSFASGFSRMQSTQCSISSV